MKKIYSLYIMLFVAALPTHAETVRIAFGETLKPWVMNEGKEGILVDILNACLRPSGHTLNVGLYPYARRIFEYEIQNVDAVADINPSVISAENLKGYYSGTLYAYENFFYSNTKNNLNLNSISDIGQHSLVSWQGAQDRLGSEYKIMATKNKNYSEMDRQEIQVRLLAEDRTDFIQMDGEIFEYYRDELINDQKIDHEFEVDRFALLGPSPNGFMFQSEQIRDDCVNNIKNLPEDDPLKSVLYFDKDSR